MESAPTHVRDLAVSAVAYDALLVAELITILAMRLRETPAWAGSARASNAGEVAPLREDESRVVLVLAQRLWGHDDTTAGESLVLRERASRTPRSLVVVSLDDDLLPPWMTQLRHESFAALGVEGAAELVLRTIADAGGAVSPPPSPALSGPSAAPPRWTDQPTPYLGQPKAQSALRRELDSLGAAIEARFDVAKGHDGSEGIWELHKLPNRVVARLDDVGVSFSWVGGRSGTVADGRLMVIEWSGVAPSRGVGALRTAQPTRERVYSAEANDSIGWRWRADAPHGRASSTASLVGEWMDGAALTSHSLAAAGT